MKRGPVQLPSLFAAWLPLAILATILSLMVHVAVQQDVRSAANDIPLQLAEDLATTLSQSQPPADAFPQQVDIAHSLAPFVVVYDENGLPADGSGRLHGQLPELPGGVFDYARHHTDDRITWQPESGVRIASVVKHYTGKNSGFVLAGRNLREIERRENVLSFEVLGGWLTALGATYVVLAASRKKTAR